MSPNSFDKLLSYYHLVTFVLVCYSNESHVTTTHKASLMFEQKILFSCKTWCLFDQFQIYKSIADSCFYTMSCRKYSMYTQLQLWTVSTQWGGHFWLSCSHSSFIRDWNKKLQIKHYCFHLCEGELEYLHCSPASRKRRQKGNPVPGV
jgi:hypothetical protein